MEQALAGSIKRVVCSAIALLFLTLAAASPTMGARTLDIRGNRLILDGRRGLILYRSSGDLDGDGVRETVFAGWTYDEKFCGIMVARPVHRGWRLIATAGTPTCQLHADVTDINGDRKLEIVVRSISGDGHGLCSIFVLDRSRLREIGFFDATRFRDLDGDGAQEVLSRRMVSFGFIGDHWLTIWKWNGRGYTDVSLRFPRQYDSVIEDLQRVIREIQYTTRYGSKHSPESNPDMFADLYHYLGKAYEYRRLPEKARQQYAIAYRLDPADFEKRNAAAFHRTWKHVHK